MGFEKVTTATKTFQKFLLYGESGCGKTVSAMTFPKKAVYDLERGTLGYAGGKFGQYIRDTTAHTAQSLRESLRSSEVRGLISSGQVETIVIDSATIVLTNTRTAIQDIKRKPLTMEMHAQVNNSMQSLWSTIMGLPCHVVVTATESDKLKQEKDGTILSLGVFPDTDKRAKASFDNVIRIVVDEKGKRTFHVIKSRYLEIKNKTVANMDFEDGARVFYGSDKFEALPEQVIPLNGEVGAMSKEEMIEFYVSMGLNRDAVISAAVATAKAIGTGYDNSDRAVFLAEMDSRLGVVE